MRRRRKRGLNLKTPSQGAEPVRTHTTRIRRSIEHIRSDSDSLPSPSELDKPYLGDLSDSSGTPVKDLTETDLDRLKAENRNLKRLHEVIHFLGAAEDPKTLVPEIVGLATSITGLTRGLLALMGHRAKDGSREFKVKVVRGITRDERRTPEVRVLRKILAKTLEERRPIFEGDARKSEFAKNERDVDLYALGAVCSVPLEAEGELWGALLLDEPQRRRDFSKVEIELCSSFARHAALALARLSDRTRLARRSERLRTEREVLRETLEETQHELKVLRRESGRLAAQSSRFAAIPNDGKLEEFLGRSFGVAKKAFLQHYLKQAIDRAEGDLERAARATGLSVAKFVKLLSVYEVKPSRSSLQNVSSSDDP